MTSVPYKSVPNQIKLQLGLLHRLDIQHVPEKFKLELATKLLIDIVWSNYNLGLSIKLHNSFTARLIQTLRSRNAILD